VRIAILAVAACAHASPVLVLEPEVGDVHATHHHELDTVDAITPAPTTPREPTRFGAAEDLRIAVVELETDRVAFADVLDRLGTALERVAPERHGDIARIRAVQHDLVHFPRTAQDPAWLCEALDAAVQALTALSPPDADAYRAQLAHAVEATRGLDRARPVRLQRARFGDALEAITRAIFIAAGEPSPSREALEAAR
jgi:hypothetical protein